MCTEVTYPEDDPGPVLVILGLEEPLVMSARHGTREEKSDSNQQSSLAPGRARLTVECPVVLGSVLVSAPCPLVVT